jgi:hypothetical protein
LGGILVTDWVRARRKAKADEPKKRLLKEMLSAGLPWRTLAVLANVTGLTESEAKRLLVEIGARGQETNPNKWGLVSRNPLPTHDPEPSQSGSQDT